MSLYLNEKERIIGATDFAPYMPSHPQWLTLPTRGFSPGLEGLRGLAILFTATSHVSNGAYAFKDPLGAVGVTIFFVLSGYNMMGALLRSETSRASSGELWPSIIRKSLLNRWKRLFPTVLATTIVIVSLYISSGRDSFPRLAHYSILALTYTTNVTNLWQDGNPGPYCNMWSLGVTEQYNVLQSIFGPIIISIPSQSRRRNIVLVLILSSFFLRLYTGAFPGTFYGIDSHFNVLCNISRFAAGALLRLIKIPRCLYRSSTANIGIALCFLTIYLLTIPQNDYSNLAPGFKDRFIAYTMWSDPLIAIATGLIIIGSRTDTSTRHASQQSYTEEIRGSNAILESLPLQFFGKISYSFYCFQLPVQIFSGWPRGWPGCGYEAMALSFAMAAHFWLDVPLQKYLRKRQPAAVPTLPTSKN